MEELGAPPPFEVLLEGTLANDPEVAAAFFRRFHPVLSRYLRAREPRHADDLEADVWLAVAAHLDRFEGGERDFRAWLFTLARNVVSGHRRTSLRRRTDVVRLDDLVGHPSSDEPDAMVVADVSLTEALAALRKHLTPTQAEVVRLRVIAGFTAAEVAELLGRSEGWVAGHPAPRPGAPRRPAATGKVVTEWPALALQRSWFVAPVWIPTRPIASSTAGSTPTTPLRATRASRC
jgi:RNA polymerase sigma-70 factor (ECF subfamily)